MCRQTLSLSFLCLLAACGGGGQRDQQDDRSAPAVVRGKPVVLPSDTAKPDTTERTRERADAARRQVSASHSLVGTMMAMGDARMIGSMYDSNATLQLPEMRAQGRTKVAVALMLLAQRTSLKELTRAPVALIFLPDSVVADSGYYQMISQRSGQPATAQQGAYATRWRMRPEGQDWSILTDHLYPASPLAGSRKAK